MSPKKLNIKYIYRSNGCKLDNIMYYLHNGSYRGQCYRCRFDSICPYSYITIYRNYEGYCIKCLRFIPDGEYSYKYVNLYSTVETFDKYNYFKDGKVS